MKTQGKNIVVDLSIELSLDVISFCEELKRMKHFELASQIFRSGTSIGANIHEAQNAESLADFIHKFKIAAKEASELRYWLLLCEKSEHLKSCDFMEKLDQIGKIMTKIIASSKKRTYSSNNINTVKEELAFYAISESAN